MSYLQKHTFPTAPAIMGSVPVTASFAELSFVGKQSEVGSSASQ